MNIFVPPPAPKTELGRPRVLSPTAGIRVSPLCLGGMSFGDEWKDVMGGPTTKEDTFAILDAFVEAGGNFIDTANNYQNEQSEIWIGEWLASRENRDQLVIATKYTMLYPSQLGKGPNAVNFSGNNKRSLYMSVRDSLKKLQTDWIDILYLHWWDFTTSVEEVMDSLHELVIQGKVMYLGISNSPAWVAAAANTYARAHGKTPFVAYQGQWNVLVRDLEREIVPMAKHFGMAIVPFGVLGSGKFQSQRTVEERAKRGEKFRFNDPPSGAHIAMNEALERVAKEVGTDNIPGIALAWVRQKARNVIPIVGGSKTSYLENNIKALHISLTREQMQYLESVVPFKPGFPHSMIGDDPRERLYPGESHILVGQHFNIDFQH